MKILVINSGSSSLKFKLFDAEQLEQIASGIIDGIDLPHCKFKLKTDSKKFEIKLKVSNHSEAIEITLSSLKEKALIKNYSEILAVGHRVVHGGEKYCKPTKITKPVLKKLQQLSALAPLHNPANLAGIKACMDLLKTANQVAIFDTAFHSSIPEKAYLYAIPREYYKKHAIRRYGFHGTSHKYVSKKASEILKKKNLKMITCHLGNGSSLTAIKNGKSIDTSMGFTPLEGVPMGTRSGNIDPAIPLLMQNKLGLNIDEVEEILMHNSGLKALSEFSSDMRKIYEKYKKNEKNAVITIEILCYKIAQYFGAYAAALNGLDAIVFTGGIGENAFYIREKVCRHLEFLGLKISKSKNEKSTQIISNQNSKITALVIPTNEEKQIAIETKSLLKI